ncbi:MAG: hypothetical protein IKS68_07205 [Mailhella sp.]|nr:hypothetical protein [Mailhella sp.]MBR6467247.1 hypothetical protein [Desulfovibrio sp.]
MKRIAKVITVCMISASLAGCANIQDDGTRTKTEGTLVGAGVGAGVGAAIGAIFGGNTKATLIGAAIGAGVGSLGGFFVGKHVADKKAEYASYEDWLDACITDTANLNEQTRQYNAKLGQDINALDKESKALAAQYKKNAASRDEMRAELRKVQALQKDSDKNIANLEKDVQKRREASADAKAHGNAGQAQKLDAEIARLDKQIKEMKAYNKRLANISVRLAV